MNRNEEEMFKRFNEKAYNEGIKLVSKYLSSKYGTMLRESGAIKDDGNDTPYKCCCIHRIDPNKEMSFYIIDLEKDKVYYINPDEVKQAMRDDLEKLGTGKLNLVDKTDTEQYMLAKAHALNSSGIPNGTVHTEVVKEGVLKGKVKN